MAGTPTGPNDPGYATLKNKRVARSGGGPIIKRDNDFGEVGAISLVVGGQRIDEERILVPAPA